MDLKRGTKIMTQLDVWLKLRGHRIEDGLWIVPKFVRVINLLDEGRIPYIKKGAWLVISYDFKGELKGAIDIIKNEMDRLDIGIIGCKIMWHEKGFESAEERSLFDSINEKIERLGDREESARYKYEEWKINRL